MLGRIMFGYAESRLAEWVKAEYYRVVFIYRQVDLIYLPSVNGLTCRSLWLKAEFRPVSDVIRSLASSCQVCDYLAPKVLLSMDVNEKFSLIVVVGADTGALIAVIGALPPIMV